MFRGNPYFDDFKITQKYSEILTEAVQEELKQHDIIFCTTSMSGNPTFLGGTEGMIYQVVIDECGMCTEPESMIPIVATQAKQVVLIGDHKQLRPVVLCRDAKKLGLETSLFQRYADRATFLNIQYRMNPRICDFPSKMFYDSKLQTGPSTSWECLKPLSVWPYPSVPHVFCNVEGVENKLPVSTEEGNENSCSNQKEVEQVVRVFKHLVYKDKVDPKQINIISQYNAQCSAIREALKEQKHNLNVNTVCASQGGEWDYVIFSTVRSLPDFRIEPRPTRGWCKGNLGFITDENQLNVALTRAREGLIIIGGEWDYVIFSTVRSLPDFRIEPRPTRGWCKGNLGFITEENQLNVALTRAREGLIIIGNRNLLKCADVFNALLDHYDKAGCVVEARNFPKPVKKKKPKKKSYKTEDAAEFYHETDMEQQNLEMEQG